VTGLGGADGAAGAGQQRRAQFALQGANLLGDSRRGQVQTPRRLGHRTGIDGEEKTVQELGVHGRAFNANPD